MLFPLDGWNPVSQFPRSKITHEQGVMTWLLSSPSVSLQLTVRKHGLVQAIETSLAYEADENYSFASWERAQLVLGQTGMLQYFVFIEIAQKLWMISIWHVISRPPPRSAALLLSHFHFSSMCKVKRLLFWSMLAN